MTQNFPTEETIAAISTAIAVGQGGIAAVRISGNAAIDISKQIVHIPGSQEWNSHTVLYGHVFDPNTKERIDEVLVLIMQAPRSFTGEDLIEITCHGGNIVPKSIIKAVIDAGARIANPGEFSYRAYLNGKIDLCQAEAISSLILSKSRQEADKH